MSDLTIPLKWSIKFVRQQKLIAALKVENALLRQKLAERTTYDLSQPVSALLRRQI